MKREKSKQLLDNDLDFSLSIEHNVSSGYKINRAYDSF